MSTSVDDIAARAGMTKAFNERVPVYFNTELLEGALRVPSGVDLPRNMGLIHLTSSPVMRLDDYQAGMAAMTMHRAAEELFRKVMQIRPRGRACTPVFRTLPRVVISPFDIREARWKVVCDIEMDWVSSVVVTLGLPPAFLED